jgi:hypothetical protein
MSFYRISLRWIVGNRLERAMFRVRRIRPTSEILKMGDDYSLAGSTRLALT